jgi:putative hemolysin
MYLAIMFLCLFFNGFIASIEMAFVSVNIHELKKLAADGNQTAEELILLRKRPERALAIFQIGLTIVATVSAAVGGVGAEKKLAPWFELNLGVPEVWAQTLAILCVIIPFSLFTVLLGEIMPKAYGLRKATALALWSVRLIHLLDRGLSPVVTLLEKSTKWILSSTYSTQVQADDASQSETSRSGSEERPVLGLQAESLPHFRALAKKPLGEFLNRWDGVVFASDKMNLEEIFYLSLSSGHRYLPYIENNRVKGLLHTREFVSKKLLHGQCCLEDSLVSVPLFSINTSSLLVLKFLLRRNLSIAVVNSDTGVPLGIVGIEQLLESAMGQTLPILDLHGELNLDKKLAPAAAGINTLPVSVLKTSVQN